jgi:hypothetical protein
MKQSKQLSYIRKFIKNLPVVGAFITNIYHFWLARSRVFPGSKNYWIQRYKAGGNSGVGSYNKLAEFKAEVLNGFVKNMNIMTVIEYGCGDGNQLKLAEYPSYIGFDVSSEVIFHCREIFNYDKFKTFRLIDECAGEKAQLTISLDVIYHLVEDDVFSEYMERLFKSSEKYVIIYSSDTDFQQNKQAAHIKHRKFSKWISQKQQHWKLLQYIPNKYPLENDLEYSSFANFYIYKEII